MSRIGYAVINIPEGVQVTVDNNVVSVKGPKGELQETVHPTIGVNIDGTVLNCTRTSEDKDVKAKHGLFRALINNMIIGVTTGFKNELELVGVGYRATVKGQLLELALGKSHLTVLGLPQEIKVTAETERGKNPKVTLESSDKQLLGNITAKIRSLRKPEPYKGKGIRFVGEHIRRKAGKTAASK